MSLLLELAQNYFLGSTGRQASLAFDESEPGVRAGLRSAVPLVLGYLLVHAQRPGGAAELAAHAQRAYGSGLLGNLNEWLTGLPSGAAPPEKAPAGQDSDLLRPMLGGDYPAAVAGISQHAGVRPATGRHLLHVALAVGLALLGRHAAQQKLDAAGLASYLASQRDDIRHAVRHLPGEVGGALLDLLSGPPRVTAKVVMQASNPVDRPAAVTERAAGLPPAPRAARADLAPVTAAGGVAGRTGAPTADPYLEEDLAGQPMAAAGAASSTGQPITNPYREEVPAGRPIAAENRLGSRPALVRPVARSAARPSRRWPWLLAVLALAGAGLGYVGWAEFAQTDPAPVASAATVPTPRGGVPATDRYEAASDTYRYSPGRPVVVQLPTGDQLRVGENTAEARLFYLLTGSPKAQPGDAQAGIRLDQVNFAAGTARLPATARAQLTNLGAVLKAFPRARLKVAGFTDNQGPPEASVFLSANRANAVRNAIVAQGVALVRVTAQGYGQAQPLASNDTPQGRAQNRRVHLLLTKK
ncbi:OmpA family protein [Hymenobacter coccineus]|uniref:OmpA-like domain-containing protein n=1 Tax=Hymenobacter coccineus TaxID=1908235 RepID=A0A1G1TJD4_9BACT|nr:OmpA family protein [Hymenobacter coccineus]OGX90967.1 hypothetical protein BEN49_05665 [Hymenobacter coccineus]